jgi:arginase
VDRSQTELQCLSAAEPAGEHPRARPLMVGGKPTLIGIPYDAASSYLRGAADAPPHIRRALESPSSNSWSESLIDLAAPGAIEDAGDLDLHGDDVRAPIEQGIRDVIAGGGLPIALGGDHSITYPILRAVRRAHPKLTILHLDAHADLYDEFEGDRYSHACPFARILEEKLADRLVQVGIRTQTGHLKAQAQRFAVETIDMRAWDAGKRPAVEGPVYLSLDLDVLDPAFAPGVSHWEPGGMSTRDVITVIQGIRGTLVGADLVEYNPVRDPSGVTAMVAAKLLKEIAARMLSS